ncbi:MAG: aldo/keto reductase [Acidobacteriaceae bacterium]|jgi:aryl-alcohol dehydrogenase-like predicted oxidoreductase|nr:aldo/keto reductase [Acidobacteriaceae bacterium]
MTLRHLGHSTLKISAIGLGCMGMSQSYGPGDEEESAKTLHRALELGINFFDTAAVYGNGANETLIGRHLGAHRQEIVLATKCGLHAARVGFPSGLDGSPAGIKTSCDESLSRLGTDVIDLFYLHRVDPKTPIEASVGAMADLVRAGKVRYLGLSEASPTTIRRAHAVHPISALQSEYSLWWREPEQTVLPVCRELGITFVPFSPLGRGFLSGRVTTPRAFGDDDFRKGLPRFQGENFEKNLSLVEQLDAFAAKKRATPSQVALAWILAKGEDLVPIPGTKRRTYLESNAAAVEIALSAADIQTLETLFAPEAVAGDRYSAQMAQWVDRS